MPNKCAPRTEDIDKLHAEISTLRSDLEILRNEWDGHLDRVFLEIALDRQRITRLEHPDNREPTHTEQAHIQKIEKHLRDSPRHAASFVELRGLLKLSPGRVSQLVRKLDPQRFEVRRGVRDHKSGVLVLRRRGSL